MDVELLTTKHIPPILPQGVR